MWLGEQIDEYGLGNGVSLIILAGIVARMPAALVELISLTNLSNNADPVKIMTPGKILFLIASFVFVVAGSILITQAQRRIPVQQAKHTRGRKVYGGQKSYLPLRVNHSGVMPIIFASSLMIFPSVILKALEGQHEHLPNWLNPVVSWFATSFAQGEFPYVICELLLIYFFAYFWIGVQFNPDDMSKQLRDHGSFIPGLRPGPRTAEYLETVMMRITFVGAAFLGGVATLGGAQVGIGAQTGRSMQSWQACA